MPVTESELYEIIGALTVFKTKATQKIAELQQEIAALKRTPPKVVNIEDVEFADAN